MNAALLWEKRLRVLMTNLVEGLREHEEIHNLSQQVTLDYHGRFLVELLQNAADSIPEGKEDSLLLILTDSLLAVLNPGAPFSDEGLEAITSIALSPKRADESIGNKGIGFKSVFEICDAPELYSVASAAHTLQTLPLTRWRLSRHPLEDEGILEQVKETTHRLLKADVRLADRLRDRFGYDVIDAVLQAFKRSAPFRYPITLDSKQFQNRVTELSLSPEDLTKYQTLVVLPLRNGSAKKVETAFRNQMVDAHRLLAFIPRVRTLRMVCAPKSTEKTTLVAVRKDLHVVLEGQERSWVRQITQEIRKEETRPLQAKSRSIGKSLTVSHSEISESEECFSWWMASTRLTAGAGSPLQAALQDLESDAWRDVKALPITVALPFPQTEPLSLAPDGRFVAGLPTLVATGSPLWMDAHFHATLSRTGLDLEMPVNKLLFDEGLRLAGSLIARLKEWKGLDSSARHLAHLAATLVFQRTKGPLAAALHRPGGLAEQAEVLSCDAKRFAPVKDLLLPTETDTPILRQMMSNGAGFSPEPWGYQLPHADLDAFRKLLLELGAKEEDAKETPRLLNPVPRRGTLLERWAQQGRQKGPDFWEPLLTWVTTRFELDQVRELTFLPTLTPSLSKPADEVLLQPLKTSIDKAEPSRAEIPDTVLQRLRFIDDQCLTCRSEAGSLTDIGRRLLNESSRSSYFYIRSQRPRGIQLIQTPERATLLKNAVPEALASAVQDKDEPLCLALLRLMITWGALAADGQNVTLKSLLLPTSGASWEKADTLALGKGWLEGLEAMALRETVLEKVYSASGRRLLNWTAFAKRLKLSVDQRETVRSWLLKQGVCDRPREQTLLNVPLLKGSRRSLSSLEVPSSIPALAPEWSEYLEYVRSECELAELENAAKHKIPVLWIEGLEQPALRESILELLITLSKGLTLEISIEQSWRTLKLRPWWIVALRRWNLNRVPTSQESWTKGNRLPAYQVCILSETEHKSRSLRRLPHLPPELDSPLTRALGVVPLTEAGEVWCVERLEAVSEAITLAQLPLDAPTEALVVHLYQRLDAKVPAHRSKGAEEDQKLLKSRLPFWRGEKLSFGRLADEPVLYLEDDPYPCTFIPEYNQRAHLPLPVGKELKRLVAVLEAIPGAPPVVRTSQARVIIPMSDPIKCTETALEWAEARCELPALRHHLASLLVAAKGGNAAVEPPQRAAWQRLTGCQLYFGEMPEDRPVFYYSHDHSLYVSKTIQTSPLDLVAELWHVVGLPWRDSWEAGVARLLRGESVFERYLQEKRFDAAHREEVYLALGLDPVPPHQKPKANPESFTHSASSIARTRASAEASARAKLLTTPEVMEPEEEPLPAQADWILLLQPATTLETVARPPRHVAPALEGGEQDTATISNENSAADRLVDSAQSGPSIPDATLNRATRHLVRGAVTIVAGGLKGARASAYQQSRPSPLEEDTFQSGPDTQESPWEVRERHPQLAALAQHFAFEQLKLWLPHFDADCWRSEYRTSAELPALDAPSSDHAFLYHDVEGKLVQPPGQWCWMVVRATRGEPEPWVRLSGAEWSRAIQCHVTDGTRFVLVMVSHTASTPRIAALVEDPVGLAMDGKLQVQLDNVWARVQDILPDQRPTDHPQGTKQEGAREEATEGNENGSHSRSNPFLAVPQSPLEHSGTKAEWHWTSRKGHTYSRESWTCCGQPTGVQHCNRTPGRFHPGKPRGSGSRSGGGGGYGFWSCCHRALSEPGCKDEGACASSVDS